MTDTKKENGKSSPPSERTSLEGRVPVNVGFSRINSSSVVKNIQSNCNFLKKRE